MPYDSRRTALFEGVTLPTLPDVLLRFDRLLAEEATGMRELAQVISRDASVTAKVLRIANSAFYGLRERVLSVEHAAAVLGGRALRNVVLQASVLQDYDHLASGGELDVPALWRHSILTAQVAHLLGERCTSAVALTPDELYTCGLLHDLGRVVLLDTLGDDYLEAVRDAREREQPLEVSEDEVLGYTHMEVGAHVARSWGLPEGVQEAVELHHEPGANLAERPAVAIVALADRIAKVGLDPELDIGLDPEVESLAAVAEIDAGEIEMACGFAVANGPLIEL